MTEQEQTLSLVRRALLTAGVLLLVLVGGIDLAGDAAGGHAGPAGPPGRRAARRRAGSRSGCTSRGEDDIARLGTSFNQMAASLQKQIRQLEELSRVQRRFVSDVSHELRTPLTTVRMAGDVLYDARERFDAADRPHRRAAAEGARPVRAAAHRPARDQPLRRRRRRPRPRGRRTSSTWPTGSSESTRALAERARHARRGTGRRPSVRGRGRRTTRRADRAQPRHQRHRLRRTARTVVVLVAADEARRRWRSATTASA